MLYLKPLCSPLSRRGIRCLQNQSVCARASWTKEKRVGKSEGRREAYYNKYQCKLPNQWRTQCVKSTDNLKIIIFFSLSYHLYNTCDRFTSLKVTVNKQYCKESGPLSNIVIALFGQYLQMILHKTCTKSLACRPRLCAPFISSSIHLL